MQSGRVLTERLTTFLKGTNECKNAILSFVKDNLYKGSRSVALCFRGEYACLYYRCHKLLEIREKKGLFVGLFNFRHARFTEKYLYWQDKLSALGVCGFSEKKYLGKEYLVWFSLNGKMGIESQTVIKILRVYCDLIDDFVDKDKIRYCFDVPSSSFKNGGCKINKSKNIEKDRQQAIYARHFFTDSDMLIYDLEYTEPCAMEKGVAGRIDLLGLKKVDTGWKLQLIEVKSTKSACLNESGVVAHVRDYRAYLAQSALIEERKREAVQSLELLAELFGFYPPLKGEEIVGAEIRFIFTDEATAYEDGWKYCEKEGILFDREEVW